MADFKDLIGKTLVRIEGMHKGSEQIDLVCSDGATYRMQHYQDCCEHVEVEDVVGDPAYLIGSPISFADESSHDAGSEEVSESGTWTFYKLATAKGWVDLRWLGSSNGYYSESVFFDLLPSSPSPASPESQHD